MFWTEVTSDGVVALLPPVTRGEGANTYNSSQVTESPAGTVVVDTAAGTGTVTVGFYVNSSEAAAFQPYQDGLMAGADTFVRHGEGVRLAANITGVTGTLRVGYAGEAKGH